MIFYDFAQSVNAAYIPLAPVNMFHGSASEQGVNQSEENIKAMGCCWLPQPNAAAHTQSLMKQLLACDRPWTQLAAALFSVKDSHFIKH